MCMSGLFSGSYIGFFDIEVDLKNTWFPSPVSFSGLYLHVMYMWSDSVNPIFVVSVFAFSGAFVL